MTAAARSDVHRRAWIGIGLLAGLWLAFGATPGRAQTVAAPIVVELFTSQGCSSCPPADAFLADLSRRRDILPLAFHIDYWDRLGWKDPFSLAEATARQRDYAHSLGNPTVYTPQMVINGTRSVVGSHVPAIVKAIADAPKATVPVALAVLGQALSIKVGRGIGEGRLWLASFDPRHATQVRAGENAGRKLVNVNIVRSLDALADWTGEAIALSRPLPPAGRGAALLLQAPSGRIIGAALLR